MDAHGLVFPVQPMSTELGQPDVEDIVAFGLRKKTTNK